MVKLTDVGLAGATPEEEIVQLAKRILKVYGKAEAPILEAEIRRMAKLLDIPIKEVLGHG